MGQLQQPGLADRAGLVSRCEGRKGGPGGQSVDDRFSRAVAGQGGWGRLRGLWCRGRLALSTPGLVPVDKVSGVGQSAEVPAAVGPYPTDLTHLTWLRQPNLQSGNLQSKILSNLFTLTTNARFLRNG